MSLETCHIKKIVILGMINNLILSGDKTMK